MSPPLSPASDAYLRDPARLAALRDTGLLDSGREEAFDRITRVAARTLGTPIALITLVAGDRQFFKSYLGIPAELAAMAQASLQHSLCQHIVISGGPLVIADASLNPLTCDSPPLQALNARSFLGVPLMNSRGDILGSFSVIDTRVRAWSDDLVQTLIDFASMVMNLIELRQHEHQLLQSETEFRAAFELDCVGKAQIDAASRRFLRVNPALCEILGYRAEELVGKSVDELTHPDDLHPNLALFERAVDGTLSRGTLQKRYIRKNGEAVWVQLSYTMIRDAQDRALHTITTVQDITAQKIAERALRETEARFNAFMDHAPVIAFIKDGEGRNIYANQRFFKAFLLDPSVVGKRDHELFPRALADRFVESDQRVLAGEVLQSEETSKTPDGETRHWYITKFPIDDATGRRFVGGVALNVTERKRALDELVQAKDAAEAASRAKSFFLANISHEIRTPLTAILGFADMLERSPSPAQHAEFCRTIRRNGEHLLAVINDVLDLSKIDAGRMGVQVAPTPLAPILDDLMSLKLPRAAARHIALQLNIPAPLPERINTDATRLRQILINLLGNAIKFTERGRVSFTILLDGSPDNAFIRFVVEDTGIGMTPGQVDSLFTPFTQADPTHARNYGGTGLGLALSRSFARMLGGDIAVTSEPEKGSAFTLTLPLGDIRAIPTFTRLERFAAPAASTTPAAADRSAKAHRVLLAEDSPDIQRLVQAYLQHAGIHVDIVEDGHAAVARAIAAFHAHQPYDLILMDRQMPSLDGYAATRQLRAAGYHLPIVALTASALAHERDECYAAGCNFFLTKPIAPDTFLPQIRRLLAQPAIDATL